MTKKNPPIGGQDKKMLLPFSPAPSSPFCPPARSLRANYSWFRNFELLIKSVLF